MVRQDSYLQDRSRWTLLIAAALMIAAVAAFAGQSQTAHRLAGLHTPEIRIDADSPALPPLRLVCADRHV